MQWLNYYTIIASGMCEEVIEVDGEFVTVKRSLTKNEKARLKLEALIEFEKELQRHMDSKGNLGAPETRLVRQDTVDGD